MSQCEEHALSAREEQRGLMYKDGTGSAAERPRLMRAVGYVYPAMRPATRAKQERDSLCIPPCIPSST